MGSVPSDPGLGRAPVSRARLRASAANWSAVHRWPQLRARPPHRGRHHSPGPDLVGPNEHKADGDQTALVPPDPTPMSENPAVCWRYTAAVRLTEWWS